MENLDPNIPLDHGSVLGQWLDSVNNLGIKVPTSFNESKIGYMFFDEDNVNFLHLLHGKLREKSRTPSPVGFHDKLAGHKSEADDLRWRRDMITSREIEPICKPVPSSGSDRYQLKNEMIKHSTRYESLVSNQLAKEQLNGCIDTDRKGMDRIVSDIDQMRASNQLAGHSVKSTFCDIADDHSIIVCALRKYHSEKVRLKMMLVRSAIMQRYLSNKKDHIKKDIHTIEEAGNDTAKRPHQQLQSLVTQTSQQARKAERKAMESLSKLSDIYSKRRVTLPSCLSTVLQSQLNRSDKNWTTLHQRFRKTESQRELLCLLLEGEHLNFRDVLIPLKTAQRLSCDRRTVYDDFIRFQSDKIQNETKMQRFTIDPNDNLMTSLASLVGADEGVIIPQRSDVIRLTCSRAKQLALEKESVTKLYEASQHHCAEALTRYNTMLSNMLVTANSCELDYDTQDWEALEKKADQYKKNCKKKYGEGSASRKNFVAYLDDLLLICSRSALE